MQKCDTAYLSKTGWNKLLVPYRFPLTCLFLFLFGLISKKLAHACFQLKCFSFSTLVDLFTAKKTKLQQCRQLHGVRVRILAPVFCPAALKCCAQLIWDALIDVNMQTPGPEEREIKETVEDENVSLPRNTMKFKLRLHKGVIDKCHAPLCLRCEHQCERQWCASAQETERVCCPSQISSAASVSRRECSLATLPPP
jgi:hypothetical protein